MKITSIAELLAMKCGPLEFDIQSYRLSCGLVQALDKFDFLFQFQDSLPTTPRKPIGEHRLVRIAARSLMQFEPLDFIPCKIGKVPFAVGSSSIRINLLDIRGFFHRNVMRYHKLQIFAEHNVLFDVIGALRMG